MGGLFGGGGDDVSTNESTSSSETILGQDSQLDSLLAAADKWLAAGGLEGGKDITGQLGGLLGAQGNHYNDVLSGKVDQTALNNALQSQADMAQQTFERNVLPSIGTASNMTGSSGSSRRGIAEGLAASDMQSQLMANQNATINQFQQQAVQNQNQAAAGMGNLFGQGSAFQGMLNGQSDSAKMLQSLMAFKDLISGNMGGTVNTEGTGTSTTPQDNNGLFGSIIGAGATVAGGMMSDERLKSNERKIGVQKLKNGEFIDIYEWDWNDKAKKLGLGKTPTVGVIAQEARKVAPDCIIKGTNGYLAVNYGKLAKEFDKTSEPRIINDTKENKKLMKEAKAMIKAKLEEAQAAQGGQQPKGEQPQGSMEGALSAPQEA